MAHLIEHALRALRAHTDKWDGLPTTTVESAAVSDEQVDEWSAELYARDLREARTKRMLVLAGLEALITAAITGTAVAKASPDTDYLQLLNDAGLVVYDTTAALNTGHAICTALNTTRGDVVAQNLFLNTTWADIPNQATADTVVVLAGTALCPWQFHPERSTGPLRRAI